LNSVYIAGKLRKMKKEAALKALKEGHGLLLCP